jgi:hypothetical protein
VYRDRPTLKNNGFLEIVIFWKSSRAKGRPNFFDGIGNRFGGAITQTHKKIRADI